MQYWEAHLGSAPLCSLSVFISNKADTVTPHLHLHQFFHWTKNHGVERYYLDPSNWFKSWLPPLTLSFFQMRTLRLRKCAYLPQVSPWAMQDLSLDLIYSKFKLLTNFLQSSRRREIMGPFPHRTSFCREIWGSWSAGQRRKWGEVGLVKEIWKLCNMNASKRRQKSCLLWKEEETQVGQGYFII